MLNQTCTICSKSKPHSAFSLVKDRKPSKKRLLKQCKACMNDRAKTWQRRNKDRAYSSQRAWREANRQTFNATMRAISKRYHDARRQATPSWADKDKIAAVYRHAEMLREFFDMDVNVDHFYPLQGELVSGLHVHQNLRIVYRLENTVKRNKLLDDEPTHQ